MLACLKVLGCEPRVKRRRQFLTHPGHCLRYVQLCIFQSWMSVIIKLVGGRWRFYFVVSLVTIQLHFYFFHYNFVFGVVEKLIMSLSGFSSMDLGGHVRMFSIKTFLKKKGCWSFTFVKQVMWFLLAVVKQNWGSFLEYSKFFNILIF